LQALRKVLVAVGPLRHWERLNSVGHAHGRMDKLSLPSGLVAGPSPSVSMAGV
jgi:hypothetical protein